MTQHLPQQLSQLSDKLKNLIPVIGFWGGRYFYDPLNKSYCCLNDIVRHLLSLSSKVKDNDPVGGPSINAAIIEIGNLDSRAETVLNDKTKGWSLGSCLISICTAVKRFLGNYSFNRAEKITSLKNRFISIVNLQPPDVAPLTPTSPTPVVIPTSLAFNTVSFSTSSTSTSTASQTGPVGGFGPPTGFNSSSSSTVPPVVKDPFALPDLETFIKERDQKVVQVDTSSSSSSGDLGPFDTWIELLRKGSLTIPTLDWSAIKTKGFKTSQLEAFQVSLMQISYHLLEQLGFLMNERELPYGIDVKIEADIQSKKSEIKQQLKQRQDWIKDLFHLMSSAGMAGYADQIRTFWAGSVSFKAKKVAGSIKTKEAHYSSTPGKHEDQWIEAIRQGHESYSKLYLQERDQLALADTVASYRNSDFEGWNLRKLYENPGLRKQVLGIVQQQKIDLEKNTSATQESRVDLLKKLTFLDSRAGFYYQETLQQPFKKVWDWTLRLQLKILGKEKSYDEGKAEAQKMVADLQKLYDSFGKQKIHKRSIEVVVQQFKPGKTDEIINELIAQTVITPDSNGFYQLGAGAAHYGKNAIASSFEGRVSHLLDIAQGKINSRFAARRLAPTFYVSASANDNFDIPTHSLPTVLQYEDLRKRVVEQVKGKFMELLGVDFDASQKLFVVKDKTKIQFIECLTDSDSVPLGPTVVSIFLDSIVSLGEKEWALQFCTFLKLQLTVTIQTSYWDKTQDLSNQFDQAIKQIESAAQSYKDDPITLSQEREYINRRDRLLWLHQNGKALVRVIKKEELVDPATGIYNGSWKLSGGPNLSTTLIPRKGSPIEMALFLQGIRGVLLDPDSVTPTYFGKGFSHNAVTQNDNFWQTLKNRTDGHAIEWVQEGLAKESAEVELGQKTPERDHTEIAYFRPAERNLVQGLFFKINDEHFAKSLRELIELQKEILDTYGFFLPIFAYKDRLFQEVVVDAELIQTLGMQGIKAAKRALSSQEKMRKRDRPQEFFNIYGTLDTQTVIAGKEATKFLPPSLNSIEKQHLDGLKKLFDLQLMALQLKGPHEKISFTMTTGFRIEEFASLHLHDYKGNPQQLINHLKTLQNPTPQVLAQEIVNQSAGVYDLATLTARIQAYQTFIDDERPVDLSLIDNLHLIFPTIFQTGNTTAEAQDLFFSSSTLVRFMLQTPAYLECWTQMVKRNMKVFLGIDLTVQTSGDVTKITLDRQVLSYFKDSADPTGKAQYAKCISRLLQLLILLGKEKWATAIKIESRKQWGEDFGKSGSTDFFENSAEISGVRDYVKNISNPNFLSVKALPTSHGTGATGLHLSNPTNSRMGMATALVQPQTPPKSPPSRFARGGTPTTPTGVGPSSSVLQNGAQALNQIYQMVWASNPPSSMSVRDQKAQTRGLLENGKYKESIAYHLIGANFLQLQVEKAFDETRKNAETVHVYYCKKFIKPTDVMTLLVNTAVRTTNGDLDLLLPRGETQITNANRGAFLSDKERRIKRYGLVKVGQITVTATGGYNTPREKLAQKISVWVISTAGPQFEKYGMASGELEVADFIVKKGAPRNNNPLFPEICPQIDSYNDLEALWKDASEKLGIAKARGEEISIDVIKGLYSTTLHEDDPRSVEADFVRLRNGDFFNMRGFKRSMYLYMKNLVLPAINGTLKGSSKSIYLKATALGAGFFSALGLKENFQTSLRKYVIEALVDAYVKLIGKGQFTPGAAVEFPFYKLESVPERLKAAAAAQGIELIWQDHRDLLDFSPVLSVSGKTIDPALFERVIKGANDAFSFDGNEAESVSLEAQVGNNSDLREVFNWHFNPYLLDSSRYIGL